MMRTGLGKVLLRELAKSLLVEDILKVLKSESEVEDDGVDVLASHDRAGLGNCGQKRRRAEDGRLHDENLSWWWM